MDVFFLDVLTEMLQSPLYFLSYINRRTSYADRLLSTHELTILSYHLQQNLWIDDKYTLVQFDENICAELDLAMLARRDKAPAGKIPEGILTRYKGSHFDRLINEISNYEYPETIDLGFMLLKLDSDTIEMINDAITQMMKLGKIDGENHDMTLVLDNGVGLTIHCNDDHESIAAPNLHRHCDLRKYAHKAAIWFGICIGATTGRLRFGVNKDFKWFQSSEMDESVKSLPKPQSLKGKKKLDFKTSNKIRNKEKVGRNEQCPCGSGKKYKKCCLSL